MCIGRHAVAEKQWQMYGHKCAYMHNGSAAAGVHFQKCIMTSPVAEVQWLMCSVRNAMTEVH